MSIRSFLVGCPCCCFDPMTIIAIYDESAPVYTNCTGTYLSDKDAWETFITGISGQVRLGIIIPSTNEDNVRCVTENWPFDSDRTEINRLVVGVQTPRVLKQDILDIFETIRTTPIAIIPQLLLFVLDNSGSMLVSQYQAELDAAKVQLQSDFPNMQILDDISNTAERWLRDARVSSECSHGFLGRGELTTTGVRFFNESCQNSEEVTQRILPPQFCLLTRICG